MLFFFFFLLTGHIHCQECSWGSDVLTGAKTNNCSPLHIWYCYNGIYLSGHWHQKCPLTHICSSHFTAHVSPVASVRIQSQAISTSKGNCEINTEIILTFDFKFKWHTLTVCLSWASKDHMAFHPYMLCNPENIQIQNQT